MEALTGFAVLSLLSSLLLSLLPETKLKARCIWWQVCCCCSRG